MSQCNAILKNVLSDHMAHACREIVSLKWLVIPSETISMYPNIYIAHVENVINF